MNRLEAIEKFIAKKDHDALAHDYKHALRVRSWIIKIAKAVKYKNLEMAQATALLHDIGRSVGDDRNHGRVGAEIAREFLTKKKLFSLEEIDEICFAIANHNSPKPINPILAKIVRDADILDMFGTIGIMRTISEHYAVVDYDANRIKGKLWQKSNKQFNQLWEKSGDPRKTIIDHINFAITCYDLFNTEYAKKIARPLVEYQKNFIKQFEKEVQQKI